MMSWDQIALASGYLVGCVLLVAWMLTRKEGE